ncbi:SnoaL-like domain-containing protein, partial [Xanthovirga aplysinae]|uniref:SnoaL-like domain-containing protein n=1 Tax=Xanthovirga aplysinae TaxID=2529853 RepID=UPI0031B641C0
KFMENIKSFNAAEVKNCNCVGNTAMVEWSMDVTFRDGNRKKLNQVAVQTWKGDKIVNEHFYYDPR